MPMYNYIEYNLNYSDTTGTLWCYSKDEVTDFNNIANTDAFKPFKYEAKLIGDTVADGANRILKISKYFLEITRNIIN